MYRYNTDMEKYPELVVGAYKIKCPQKDFGSLSRVIDFSQNQKYRYIKCMNMMSVIIDVGSRTGD